MFDFGWYSIYLDIAPEEQGWWVFLLSRQHLLSVMLFMDSPLHFFEKLVLTGVFGFVFSLVLAEF